MTRPTSAVAAPSAELIEELVTANRIIFDQKVVDGFGHISVRHDRDPTTYLMARNIAPGLVTAADIVVFDLDSDPVAVASSRYYSERFIHGEIYKARPDVRAVIHCHAPQLIPFGATGVPLRPIFEIREAGGMTDMLVRTPQLGKALAISLGDKPIVLMHGHGATMVGVSIKQVVYRAIYAALNAGLQMDAARLGEAMFLDPEEAVKATELNDRVLE